MGFGSVGIWEVILILAVLLLVFGAKRLPEIGAALGKGIREFKGSVKDIENEINRPADRSNLPRSESSSPRSELPRSEAPHAPPRQDPEPREAPGAQEAPRVREAPRAEEAPPPRDDVNDRQPDHDPRTGQ
jgi:sec-independent protein translocase protein TatA